MYRRTSRISATEMSIALERNNSCGGQRIEGPGFVHRDMACVSSVFDSPGLSPSDLRSLEEDRGSSLSSSSTSSIGKNSDDNPGGSSGCDEEEVQSEYKGGPLDSLDSLEEVLPVKKSISKFYSGKSKSFTSLSDAASCPSIQDITKPENAYTRKRKNLLAFNNLWEKNCNSTLLNRRRGISKRPTNSRSMLALTATMNGSESNSGETPNSNSSPPGHCLPPLPPHARRNTNNELSHHLLLINSLHGVLSLYLICKVLMLLKLLLCALAYGAIAPKVVAIFNLCLHVLCHPMNINCT